MCVPVCICMHVIVHVWRSVGSLLYCMGSGARDQAQVIRHGSKHFYPPSQLTGPREKFSAVKYSKHLLSKTM